MEIMQESKFALMREWSLRHKAKLDGTLIRQLTSKDLETTNVTTCTAIQLTDYYL